MDPKSAVGGPKPISRTGAVTQRSAVNNLSYPFSLKSATAATMSTSFVMAAKFEQQESLTYCLRLQTRSGKDSHKKMTSSLPITQCSAARNAVCASNPSCQVSNIFKSQKKDTSMPCFQMLSQWNTIIYWTNNIKYQQLIWSQSCPINTNLIQTPTTDLYLTSQLPYVGCPPLTCQCPADHQPAANK